MSDTKKDEPEFMIGQGFVGALLLDIIAGPCLRLDDKRWSMNTGRGNLVMSQKIVERLTEKGFVKIADEKLMERDLLALTDAGVTEVQRYALWRSVDLAQQLAPPMVPLSNGNEADNTTDGTVYDLAEKAFEVADAAKVRAGFADLGSLCPGRLVLKPHDGPIRELTDVLTGDDRLRLLFVLLNDLANSSMCGLSIGEMPDVAAWAAVIAGEAFRRAPDQDWEFDNERGEAA